MEGHVANYVETEQILLYHHYALAFIQVRGSVPIFWYEYLRFDIFYFLILKIS